MFKHTAATKQKLSRMRKGEKNPFFGRKHTAEARAAMSARMSARNDQRRYDIQPVTLRNLDITEWAYVAGLIDGEGSIAFKRGQPTVSIYNCFKPLMVWLHEKVGGAYRVNDRRGRTPNYCWSIGGARNCAFLLRHAAPFLIIKRNLGNQMVEALRAKYGSRLDG